MDDRVKVCCVTNYTTPDQNKTGYYRLTNALPNELITHVRNVGIEPTTYRLDRFAVSIPKLGAGDRSRTDDIYLGKVMLYQLSYTRIV